jgi:hypothetical protein
MGMYTTRVKGRQILLKNPVRKSRAKKELLKRNGLRKRRSANAKKPDIIGKKEARQKDSWKSDKKQAKCALPALPDI